MNKTGLLANVKYPKFMLFILVVILAFYFYELSFYPPLHDAIIRLELIGAFLAGMLYTSGFTTPFAVALFLVIGQDNNILISAIIGGFGSLLGDSIIFRFIRHSFSDEIRKFYNEPFMVYLRKVLPANIKKYLAPIIGAAIIASPFPDELGIALLAATRHLSQSTFMIISYTLNTIGILIILEIGRLL